MEVHHHSHTERKKWTHYLWEFLMLFLAVFCGFLAENQREHFVEQKRAGEYAQTLVNDLRVDTSEIRRGKHWTEFMIASIDSLSSIAANDKLTKDAPGSFYYYSAFLYYAFIIDWSRSTLDQLIQSGSLRYFRNKELVGLINLYYYSQNIINEQNHLDFIQRDKITEIRNHILQLRYYITFGKLDMYMEENGHQPSPLIDSLITQRLPLQADAEKEMDEFINHLIDRRNRLELVSQKYYPFANDLAIKIIQILTKEYHLK
ncbi:MAG: hypothetical protein E6H08_02285 [Bacteroidetes bacterium]|nr:MAG: hypothetical protein E6H08_02285 [Bacteroidota bacterium]